MLGFVRQNEYVDIGVSSLLAAGKGAKEPSFQDGLRLEVFGYLLCHCLCTHNNKLMVFAAKIGIIIQTSKKKGQKNSEAASLVGKNGK